LRDYVIYVAIGLLCVIGIAVFAVFSARRGTPPQFKNDWTVTVVTAGIAFGYLLRNRSLKHDARFWLTWCVMLLVHFAVFLSMFSRVEKVPLI
jgi:phosphatidylglycerophosphate synthase